VDLGSRVDCLGFGPESIDVFLPLLSALVEVVDVCYVSFPLVISGREGFRAVDRVDDARVDIVFQQLNNVIEVCGVVIAGSQEEVLKVQEELNGRSLSLDQVLQLPLGEVDGVGVHEGGIKEFLELCPGWDQALGHGGVIKMVGPFFREAFLHVGQCKENLGLSQNERELLRVSPEALVQRSGESPILRLVPTEGSQVCDLVPAEGDGENGENRDLLING
jgi:hypothetical protein